MQLLSIPWLLQVESLTATLYTLHFQGIQSYLSQESAFLVELTKVGYFGGSLSISARSVLARMFDRFSFNLTDVLPTSTYAGSKELPPPEDLQLLAKYNTRTLRVFRLAMHLLQPLSCFGKDIEMTLRCGRYPELNALNQRLRDLNLTRRRPDIHYGQYYAEGWTGGKVAEEREHLLIMRKMHLWSRDRHDSRLDTAMVRAIHNNGASIEIAFLYRPC